MTGFLKFANLKANGITPKMHGTNFLQHGIRDDGWNRAAKYRSMAIFQELGDKKIIVFNLDECLQVFTEVVKSGDGKQKRSTVINMPEDWKAASVIPSRRSIPNIVWIRLVRS